MAQLIGERIPPLVGREAETGLITQWLTRCPRQGRGLVITGPAGIGSSRLAEIAADQGRRTGALVLTVTGSRAEAGLPFAGLQRLLRPVLEAAGPGHDLARALPGLVARGGSGSASIPAVGLAVVALVDRLAAVRHLLLVADDADRLDPPTRQVLGLVARRLDQHAVTVVVAGRQLGGRPPVDTDLPELLLTALDAGPAGELLDHTAAGLNRAERAHLAELAGGHPLALVELPIAWRAAGARARVAPSGPPPITDRLAEAFLAGMDHLDPRAVSTALVAAAGPDTPLAELLTAAGTLLGDPDHQVDRSALDRAVEAGLVSSDGTRMTFRHPLTRAALLHVTPGSRRRAVHAALARACAHHPDDALWHRANAADGPDEPLAVALERRYAAAIPPGPGVAALELAARLSADDGRRRHRLLLAAGLAADAGRAQLAELLLAEALPPVADRDRPRLESLRERLERAGPGGPAGIVRLDQLARRAAADGDRELADDLTVARQVRAWQEDLGPDRPCDLASASLALLDDPDADPERLRRSGTTAFAAGDPVTAARLLGRAVDGLLADGRPGRVPAALVARGWAELWLGDWSAAREAAERAGELADQLGLSATAARAAALDAALHGLRGDAAGCLRRTARVAQDGDAVRWRDVRALLRLARGGARLGGGGFAEAVDELLPLFDPGHPDRHRALALTALPDLAEAAAHLEADHPAAVRVCAVIARLQRSSPPSPLGTNHLGYATAMLAPARDTDLGSDRADPEFARLLAADLVDWPWLRARIDLAVGVRLRRRRRVAASRLPLHAAQAGFEALGAVGWAERTRAELRATGERADLAGSGPWSPLSPQELRIARLAAQGLSNREIGHRLYLSPRTVGSHLYRIFPKLDVSSRTELASRLEATG